MYLHSACHRVSNDSDKILPGRETLPKYVRLPNFFHIQETNSHIIFINKRSSNMQISFHRRCKTVSDLICIVINQTKQAKKLPKKAAWYKMNLFSEMLGQYFSEGERVISLFFPHQLSAVSRAMEEIYFQMRNTTPCLHSSQLMNKLVWFSQIF